MDELNEWIEWMNELNELDELNKLNEWIGWIEWIELNERTDGRMFNDTRAQIDYWVSNNWYSASMKPLFSFLLKIFFVYITINKNVLFNFYYFIILLLLLF